MEERYLRNIPTLSEAECALLREKRILIVGCGGLGGYLSELMLRVGVTRIRLCDGDVFEPTNLNRQILSTPALLGTKKADAAAARCRQINPNAEIESFDFNMTEENVSALLRGCDAVLDALDNIAGRKILARACSEADIPYIFGAVSGWTAQAALFLPKSNPMDTLYPQDTVIRDKSVLSFTPALCACMQAALCVNYLTGRPVEIGKLYLFDLLDFDFETIPLP